MHRFVFYSAGACGTMVRLFGLPVPNSPILGSTDNCEAFQSPWEMALCCEYPCGVMYVAPLRPCPTGSWHGACDSSDGAKGSFDSQQSLLTAALLTWPTRCPGKAITPSFQWQHAVNGARPAAMHTSLDCAMNEQHTREILDARASTTARLFSYREEHKELQHCKMSWSEYIT